jgi:hypothetical protein
VFGFAVVIFCEAVEFVAIEHFEQRQVSVVGHSYVIQLQVTL